MGRLKSKEGLADQQRQYIRIQRAIGLLEGVLKSLEFKEFNLDGLKSVLKEAVELLERK